MSSYSYVAVDPTGIEMRGSIEVADQSEALRRIKEMGLFPTKLLDTTERRPVRSPARLHSAARSSKRKLAVPLFQGRVKPKVLTTFTRQLATLVEAGLPLLRGLRLLEEQEVNPTMKAVVARLSDSVEGGSSFGEAVAAQPKIFNALYVNMVRAGEISGALEVTLQRLAEFMEKAQKIKGKVTAALFYPGAVLTVAAAILGLLMVYVVPRFQQVFEGLSNGRPLPAFTMFVFGVSNAVCHHIMAVMIGVFMTIVAFSLLVRTNLGRRLFDSFKLTMPILGAVFRKAAIARFARTLGTLASNGVPILQALNIVKDTAGNVVVGSVVSSVHENVKQGEPIAPTLKASGVFPAMVAGMVDVGEQTGALPEMLMKVADNYDDEVDDATNAMASLLEPIMIVLLAVIVGSIVIAMFLPIISIIPDGDGNKGEI